MEGNTPPPFDESDAHVRVSKHVSRNIEMLSELRAQAEDRVGKHQRFIERLTRGAGRVGGVYVIVCTVALWTIYNTVAWHHDLPTPDPPPFAWLQGVVGLGSLLFTTMILTTQNRQAEHAEQRSQLDLQVNLLAEQKVAKIIALIEELRVDMPSVGNRRDPLAEAMTVAVDPKRVLSAMEAISSNSNESLPSPHGHQGAIK